jgi:hypothetical protein
MTARRDTTTEAFEALCDLSLTEREAVRKALRLTRRYTPENQAFTFIKGLGFRIAKAERRFNADQLARWAGEGGYEP